MPRSVIAIVVGFVVIAAFAFGTDALLRAALPGQFDANGRVDSVPLLTLTLAYITLYATFGCYVTARLAPSRPTRHALVLGLLGLASNVVGTVQMWHTAPAWYHVAALALVMPTAWLGGRLRERQLAARPIPLVA